MAEEEGYREEKIPIVYGRRKTDNTRKDVDMYSFSSLIICILMTFAFNSLLGKNICDFVFFVFSSQSISNNGNRISLAATVKRVSWNRSLSIRFAIISTFPQLLMNEVMCLVGEKSGRGK